MFSRFLKVERSRVKKPKQRCLILTGIYALLVEVTPKLFDRLLLEIIVVNELGQAMEDPSRMVPRAEPSNVISCMTSDVPGWVKPKASVGGFKILIVFLLLIIYAQLIVQF